MRCGGNAHGKTHGLAGCGTVRSRHREKAAVDLLLIGRGPARRGCADHCQFRRQPRCQAADAARVSRALATRRQRAVSTGQSGPAYNSLGSSSPPAEASTPSPPTTARPAAGANQDANALVRTEAQLLSAEPHNAGASRPKHLDRRPSLEPKLLEAVRVFIPPDQPLDDGALACPQLVQRKQVGILANLGFAAERDHSWCLVRMMYRWAAPVPSPLSTRENRGVPGQHN